ncbi:alpha/beta fold hydrolase [Metabacillus fastidiosus]|uniref:Alpha/beta fold hydrolase n=1 Tax=Metabacillus fastidiosus TaxID=1458 RepID=A0ABU6P1N4_9BACI|nr:alpha/beta fold hydrolase [Metabacillus fastidiosus]
MRTIFLTGGTGFIGKELLKELIKEEINIFLLVRSKIKAALTFQEMGIFNKEIIHLVEGDLTKKDLALSNEDRSKVLKADVIIHAGGPMDIQVGENEAVSSFLQGAKYIGELAKSIHQSKGLKQFIHIVGYMSPFDDHNSKVSIDVFKEGNKYLKIKNPYERTKFLADLYIRQQASEIGYPLSVVNPPVVVGSSKTGSTEQLGGLGMLVSSVRKGLMPVIPGGKNYRLPIIANDDLAKFIVQVSMQDTSSIKTYTLVSDKRTEPHIPELLSLMSESMNMKAPTLSVPISSLKILLNSGLSKITKIPSDGLNFITKREFSNDSLKEIMKKGCFGDGRVRNLLPLVVADLDYRLTYPSHQMDKRFERSRIGNTAVYQIKGEGKPFILFHGLLCDGEDMFPLGIRIHKKTGQPVWIVDLPGLGRSPFKREKNLIDTYINMVKDLLKEADNGAHLIGHSFGAVILIEAIKENVIRIQDTLTLLQLPVLKNQSVSLHSSFISKWALKLANYKRIKQYLLKKGLFDSNDNIPLDYVAKVRRSFTSPRILNTTIQLNTLLLNGYKVDVNMLSDHKLHIIWGNKDVVYIAPTLIAKINYVPYGHHFPISNPSETADIILHKLFSKVGD